MRNLPSPAVFYRPGVNPQNMDPEISGDTALLIEDGEYLIGVIDGAWVKGFNAFDGDIAQWSSQTIADEIKHAVLSGGGSASELIATALPAYRQAVAELKQQNGYSFAPPPPFEDLDPLKVGPQSAFALARFDDDGSIEIAQVRDCLVVLEMADDRMIRLTPNQSEINALATKRLAVQHEGLSYQTLAREIILAGEWADRHGEITAAAQGKHKPDFFEKIWLPAANGLSENLSGEAGFMLWREIFDTLCLCNNSQNFLNNSLLPKAQLDDGTWVNPGWNMFTGEYSMFTAMYTQTLKPAELDGAVALWLMSDGAFKQGDRGSDLKAMRELGPECYYRNVLLPRFEGKCFHPERVPMDVTIIRQLIR